jgi:thioredoxin-related protein
LSTNLKNRVAEPLGMLGPNRPFTKTSSFLAVGLVVLVDFLVGAAQFNSSPERTELTSGTSISCVNSSCPTRRSAAQLAQPANVPTGKPRLLEFSSQHCASCGRMATIVKSMEHNCTARDGTILRIDVDEDEGGTLAERYRVNQLPTFVMIDSKGDEVGRLTGEQPRQRLAIALADVNGVLCATL